MSRRMVFLFLIPIMMTACTKRVDVPAPNETDTTPLANNEEPITPKEKYRQVQIDFSGYSTEGGFILAYYNDENALQRIDVYLLGERGKVIFIYDMTTGRTVEAIRTEYQYEQSISETEGDVKIISKDETKYVIEDQSQIIPADEDTLEVFRSALKAISNNGE